LRELRHQVIGAIQSMLDTGKNEAIFDSKILGKFLISADERKIYMVRNGAVLSKLAGTADEIDKKSGVVTDSQCSEIYHFDFSQVYQKLGVDEK
tara:strand:+ start:318 stop:599 length:282 start_codon:yes stop_codon:yes gene_type:complete